MKAIPITKKLCTAGGGYASPAKLDPATIMQAASMAKGLMGDKKKQTPAPQKATPKPEEEENKQTASEKKLFINE
jgi:phage/plasmid primase-like uncharacterized protein